jgi:Fe-S cluster biosynthesis and repair protein YggX
MGLCQQYYLYWTKSSDVMVFAAALSGSMQKSFLVVISSVCWSIWKHRNTMVFDKMDASSVKNLILLIISMVHYWIGNCKAWMSGDLDLILLQVVGPALALLDGIS